MKKTKPITTGVGAYRQTTFEVEVPPSRFVRFVSNLRMKWANVKEVVSSILDEESVICFAKGMGFVVILNIFFFVMKWYFSNCNT